MTDYAKKKNDELAALCKERGLAHTGKKADLVKRLEDHDANATETPTKESAKTEGAETKVDAPVEDIEGKTATEPRTDTADTKDTAETAETKAPAQDFSLGLEDRTLDDEIEKRKKRAAKFGLDPSQDETLKQMERAKRFGTTNLPGLLNQALPERAERNKKRGREAKDDTGDRKRSRQRPAQDKDSKPLAKSEENGAYPKWMTASDREAADKRKAKFGGA